MSFTIQTLKELREKTGAGMMDCKAALTESGGNMEDAITWLRKKGRVVAEKKSSREATEGSVGIYTNSEQTKTAILKLNCETDFVSLNDNFRSLLNKLGKYLLESNGTDFLSFNTKEGTIGEIITDNVTALGENLAVTDFHLHAHTAESVVGSYVHSNSKIGSLVDVQSSSGIKEPIAALAKDLSMHVTAFRVEALDSSGISQETIDRERDFLTAQAKESGKPDAIIAKMIDGRIQKFKKEICLLEQPFVKNPDITVEQHIAAVSKETGSTLRIAGYVKYAV